MVAAPVVAPHAEPASFHFRTVTWQADGFGFDATSGEFFTASPTALMVMQALSEGMARPQIVSATHQGRPTPPGAPAAGRMPPLFPDGP